MIEHHIKASIAQIRALLCGASSVLIVEDAGGLYQRGDQVRLSEEDIDGLPIGNPPEVLTINRVHAGTKKNGVLPGFSVLELRGGDLLIEHRAGASAEVVG